MTAAVIWCGLQHRCLNCCGGLWTVYAGSLPLPHAKHLCDRHRGMPLACAGGLAQLCPGLKTVLPRTVALLIAGNT